jgi:hypothetical protein
MHLVTFVYTEACFLSFSWRDQNWCRWSSIDTMRVKFDEYEFIRIDTISRKGIRSMLDDLLTMTYIDRCFISCGWYRWAKWILSIHWWCDRSFLKFWRMRDFLYVNRTVHHRIDTSWTMTGPNRIARWSICIRHWKCLSIGCSDMHRRVIRR